MTATTDPKLAYEAALKLPPFCQPTWLRPIITSRGGHQIAGGGASFNQLDVVMADCNGGYCASRMSYDQLLASADDRNLASTALDRITAARPQYAGLDMERAHLMGVLNVTPDSFSDGGQFNTLNQAVKRTHQMIAEGADIIDVGGESTRPGAKLISIKKEKERVLKVISKIKKNLVSIDTRKAEVMKEAVKNGAKIINDVSALDFDNNSFATVIKLKKPVILNHSQGTPDIMQNNPKYQNVLLDIYDYFENKINQLVKKGFSKTLASHLSKYPPNLSLFAESNAL